MIDNFLCLPFFQVADAPIKEVLALLIKKDYFQPASAFSEDLTTAQNLQTALAGYSTSEPIDLARYQQIIIDFYNLIEGVSRRFPDNVASFEWFSTLRYLPSSRIVTTWKEEQAHLVYQLGVVYCKRAHGENIFHEEGVKRACLYFKNSAGCFEHLLAISNELGDQSGQSLNRHTIETLKLMMLAQAQEVIWLKAVSNPSMKNTLVARLSKKVADFYEEAIAHALQSNTIILDWTNHMRVKMHHFIAASYYRMAIVALDSFEYGQQVAFLKAALEKCTEALKHKRYVGTKVLEDLQGLNETVSSILRTAEKENDLVFLKPVPLPQELPLIDAVSMVNPEVPDDLKHAASSSAFAALVPFTVIQVAQAFKEREETYIRQSFAEPLSALGRMLHQFLAQRDLPATIDTIQKPESIPDSIINHLKEIVTIGGLHIIEDSMVEISELALKSKDLIFECEERLRMESYEDELLRERAGDSWNREPSLVVSADLCAKLDKMKNFLQQGHRSDVLIGEAYEKIRPALEAYCGGKESLQRRIPSLTYVKLDPEIGKLVNELKVLLTEANKLDAARQKFTSSVDGKSRTNSVLSLVLSEYKKSPSRFSFPNGSIDAAKFEPIYEKQIQRYLEDKAYVESLKIKQQQLESQIDQSNVKFVRSREALNSAAHQERLRALQFFESAYVEYLELIANLNRASSFYSDFLEKGNGVLREVEEFLYSRREQARELTQELQNQQNFNQIEHSMGQPKLAAPQSVRPRSYEHFSDET